MMLRNTAIAVCLIAGMAVSASAATKVTLSDLHLCCGACVKAVTKAVDSVEGAEVTVDKAAGSAVVTASSDETAQAAIDAIAKAGFHATSDSEKLAMKENSGAADKSVKRLEVTNVHNCCGGCNVAIKKAVDSVDGVEGSSAKPKKDSFVVEGDFNALALVKALNAAGFHVTVK
ncbi:MAG: cation transporter [bacterium]|nr:cation transporter [bacterium]